jgi:3-oxoadipate enol-lactonase / 4-carboxymuconolactone decarboxylase
LAAPKRFASGSSNPNPSNEKTKTMPFANVNNTRIFYRLEGSSGLPVLVLSHSIGTDHALWEPQAPELIPYFQILRYDTRGHGASEVPDGDYSVEQLGRDVLGLVDTLNISRFAFCGLSMGGAVGQWLAVHSPERMTALVLANTSPRFGTPEHWNARIEAVKKGGMAAISDAVMQRFFSAESLNGSNPFVSGSKSVFLGTDPAGYMRCCAALRDFDFTAKLRQLKVPSLVIVGDHDVSTPLAGNGDVLAREIPGSTLVRLPTAHLSNLEAPRSFNSALFAFLQPRAKSVEEFLQAGFAVRRKVLGDEHVDRAIASVTALTDDFQSLITQYAWGTVWTRPALDLRTRRLLVLATMAALGRWEEFRMHVSTGLAHRLEVADIKETLLQTAIYAGVPAANTAFHIAQEEIDKRK